VLDRHQLLQAHLSLTLVVAEVVEIVAPVVLAALVVLVAVEQEVVLRRQTVLLELQTQAAVEVAVESPLLVAALAAAV
jgi:hypothetical protein